MAQKKPNASYATAPPHNMFFPIGQASAKNRIKEDDYYSIARVQGVEKLLQDVSETDYYYDSTKSS